MTTTTNPNKDHIDTEYPDVRCFKHKGDELPSDCPNCLNASERQWLHSLTPHERTIWHLEQITYLVDNLHHYYDPSSLSDRRIIANYVNFINAHAIAQDLYQQKVVRDRMEPYVDYSIAKVQDEMDNTPDADLHTIVTDEDPETQLT